MLTQHSQRAPLGRTVTTEEVGNTAAFLCSDYASGITVKSLMLMQDLTLQQMPLVEIEN